MRMKMTIAGVLILHAAALVAQPSPSPPPALSTDQADETGDRLEARAAQAVAVLTGRQAADEVFAPSFLAQVPAAQLQALAAQLIAAYGPLDPAPKVMPAGPHAGEIALHFARAEARGQLVLEPGPPHRIAGLQIGSVTPTNDSAAALEADLAALPGMANAYFAPLNGGSPRLSHNAETPLALGSAFKLYVLAALQRSIAEGGHRWDQVVPLAARSYPSGVMQDWAPGTPVTVQTLATLMIQISDNTATDQLVAVLGRDRVEAEFRRTARNAGPTLPFLTTREMFAVKTDPALRDRYAAAPESERRRMIAALPPQGPSLAEVSSAFAGAPMAIDRIEWFASPRELAALLKGFTGPDAATARGILAASKGMGADASARWNYAGFKGGSEPGVLNLTWLLQDKSGKWHIATLGWNDPAATVDQARLTALATRLQALAE